MNYFELLHATLTLEETWLGDVSLNALPTPLINAIAEQFQWQLRKFDSAYVVTIGYSDEGTQLVIRLKKEAPPKKSDSE